MQKIFLLIFILAIDGLLVGVDRETIKIMPFVSDARYCTKCHENSTFPDSADACKNYCITCHKENDSNHHSTNASLKKVTDYSFKLTDRKKITCRTCHNLKLKRHAESAWKAESLYDSLFSKKKQYKTYYLPIKNNKGQLCKKCH